MMFFFYQYICFGYTTDREMILKPWWNSTDKTNDANKMKWWVSFKQIGFSDSSSLAIPVGDAYGIVDVHFFFHHFCPAHISGTVTRRDSKFSVLLGPAV